jgi:uroporphyrinogen-III synthase
MVQENQTLKGKTVAITRPREQAEDSIRTIEGRGGKAYLLPTIDIRQTTDPSATKTFFDALASKKADYVIFMSVNGVRHLLNAAESLGIESQLKAYLKETLTLAVGSKTANEMQARGIRVDLIPEKYTSEGILQCLRDRGVEGKSIYIPRTSEAPPELAMKLRGIGGRVEEVYVYQSQLPSDRGLAEQFVKDLEVVKIDAIVFSSSLGVKNFLEMLREIVSKDKLLDLIRKKCTVVAIGPTTAKTLIEVGLGVDVMPEKHIFEEALSALARYWNVKKMCV